MIYILVFSVIFLALVTTTKINFYTVEEQDLNLDKEFKTKKHFFYEKCSVCGKKLRHARSCKKGDNMYCTVECRGKTTWYCEKCNKERLDKIPNISPFDYIGEI